MTVDIERHGAVMLVTLNRPEAGNALDPDTGTGISDAFAEVLRDAAVRVVVVTGSGSKVFCAGMDLKAFAAGVDMTPVGQGIHALRSCPKPVIAAINGSALAGGFELMMCCDLVVAADHAKFGLPEVKRGLVAAGGGTRLPARIPLTIALELGLTGQPIDATRAADLGLVNRVVPADQVLATALDLAAIIGANGPLALEATKRLMYDEVGQGDAAHVAAVVAPVFASADAREGATAFAQKRLPVWSGQ
ncbi:MAG: Enoyl-CoA hydratase/isomerase [Acidimicrobiales bacterium]|nr:Enoyl-CoA hydratase/isomerase [Acidimicrobiales bacterium]